MGTEELVGKKAKSAGGRGLVVTAFVGPMHKAGQVQGRASGKWQHRGQSADWKPSAGLNAGGGATLGSGSPPQPGAKQASS